MKIPFEIKGQLNKLYPFRTELHAHTTPASTCSEIQPEKLVEIYVEKGYDALVLTNHFSKDVLSCKDKKRDIDNWFCDYERCIEAARGTRLQVILGAEVRFSENTNDYLIYGVNEEILSVCYDYFDKGVEKYREEVRLEKSLFIKAHPYRNGITPTSSNLLDGVEAYNMHPGHNSRIGLACRYANENPDFIVTAGSDFHHLNKGHEGLCALRTKEVPNDTFELVSVLKSRDYVLEIGEDSIILP